MAYVRPPVPQWVGPRPLAVGAFMAFVMLFGVLALWTRRPALAFFVSFGGQFVSAAGLYLFVQYRSYGTGIDRHAVGSTGGVAGLLIRDGESDSEMDRRRQLAGVVLAFSLTAFVGFLVLSFAGGDVVALLP